jgi:hypothetical protein
MIDMTDSLKEKIDIHETVGAVLRTNLSHGTFERICEKQMAFALLAKSKSSVCDAPFCRFVAVLRVSVRLLGRAEMLIKISGGVSKLGNTNEVSQENRLHWERITPCFL